MADAGLGANDKVDDLYDKVEKLKKVHPLIIIPTTCGTGSEVTNISVINRVSKGDSVLKNKPLKEFGVKESDLPVFAKDVAATQQRLLKNNYIQLSEEQLLDIYNAAF